jgi:hypothetical protein
MQQSLTPPRKNTGQDSNRMSDAIATRRAAQAQALAALENGDPALVGKANHHCLGCWPDKMPLKGVLGLVAQRAGLTVCSQPEAVRIRRRGQKVTVFNYGDTSWAAPDFGQLVMGTQAVAPQSLSVWIRQRH